MSSCIRMALALSMLCLTLKAEQDSAKVELVKAGNLEEARADWWGFDDADSTKFLQAAINSGVKKLIVPNMGKPWVVHPIKLTSNQEIVFEPGTVVEAIRGGFKGRYDSLFSARGKKNITLRGKDAVLRMRKQDYQDKTQYVPATWRMVVGLYSCENVKIIGLTLMSSGGDGVYVGNAHKPLNYCKDIVIKDCVIDDNYRQGISVISVVNLLIENCVIKNTKGALPEAGIDFEPNSLQERLFNITVRDCVFKNNQGAGVIIAFYPAEDTEPISINFENCKAINNGRNGFMGGFGLMPPLWKIDAKMSNCTEIKDGKTTIYNDFWKDFYKMAPLDKQKQEIVDRVKRLKIADIIADMKLKPVDKVAYQQAKNLTMPVVRGKNAFILDARKGDKVAFKTTLLRGGGAGMTIDVQFPSGSRTNLAKFSGMGQTQALSLVAKETGTHIINFDPGGIYGGWFEVETTQQGMAMLATPIHFFRGTNTLFFYVPADVAEFYVIAAGDGGERVKVSLYDADGNLVEEQDTKNMYTRLVVSRKDASKGEIWMLKTDQANDSYLEDYFIGLVGVPPILSPDKRTLLMDERK